MDHSDIESQMADETESGGRRVKVKEQQAAEMIGWTSYFTRVWKNVMACCTTSEGLTDVEAEGEVQGTKTQRLHYGLVNQGATCYLNSVLQVLFVTTEIQERLDQTDLPTDVQLKNIFEALKKESCGTEDITSTFGIINVHEQCDAAECLETILRQVSPQVSKVFQGDLTYKIKCETALHLIIEETNPFWILPLSLTGTHDSTYSVKSGFERIFESKLFSGDNMVYCQGCEKKTEATSGCEMVTSPQILTLLLKRFDFDYNTMSYVKSHCCVEVPHTLQRKAETYELYGMINHMGSLRGGHYTATIQSDDDKIWYECNDDHVKKAEGQPFARETSESSTAYLLMYRKTEETSTEWTDKVTEANLTEDWEQHPDNGTKAEEKKKGKRKHRKAKKKKHRKRKHRKAKKKKQKVIHKKRQVKWN